MPDLTWMKEYMPDPEQVEEFRQSVRRFGNSLSVPDLRVSGEVPVRT